MKKSTTFRSLLRRRVVGKETPVGVAEKERTTEGRTVFEQENHLVESRPRSMPMATKPLVDVIVNKML